MLVISVDFYFLPQKNINILNRLRAHRNNFRNKINVQREKLNFESEETNKETN